MVCTRFWVTGRVQGVGFRWSAQEEARRFGLAGWVRNADDGSVEGLVQGGRAEVQKFTAWLRHGPRGAQVTNLELEDAEPTSLRIFTVRQ